MLVVLMGNHTLPIVCRCEQIVLSQFVFLSLWVCLNFLLL